MPLLLFIVRFGSKILMQKVEKESCGPYVVRTFLHIFFLEHAHHAIKSKLKGHQPSSNRNPRQKIDMMHPPKQPILRMRHRTTSSRPSISNSLLLLAFNISLIIIPLTAFTTTGPHHHHHPLTTTTADSKRTTHLHYNVPSSSSTTTKDAVPTTVASAANKMKKRFQWFPTRIQETLNYDEVVSRLYVRHIVTETENMAQDALQMYLKTLEDSDDPFGDIAKSLSACESTRHEGGKIGWVERNNATTEMFEILPTDVLQAFFRLEPKAGDVHVLESESTNRWHVLQCLEVWTNLPTNVTSDSLRVGSFSGTNKILTGRRKLKGLGVVPTFPQEMQSYHIQTVGCQMNVADSERLEGVLQNQMGLSPSQKPEQADVVILNTCSIRDHAEQKLYDSLGPYAAQKRKGKQVALIVTGCVAQQEGEALLKRVPEIDVVLGPQYVPYLKNVLENVRMGQQMVTTAPMLVPEDDSYNPYKPVRGHKVRAWVNVIHGCNEHCTYCVVPGTRGMEVSRTMEAILSECLGLAKEGYKEVTLLGQNIDAYGRDMVPKRTFAELLEFLNANLRAENMRIRYVTSHPRYFSDRVIDAVANLDQVCECFHMPFQAGDDEVLRKMRRGYSYKSYMHIINKIKEKAPDAAICTDIIVGFPGESEEAFQKTLKIMKEVKFDNVNSFAYSPRPNTEAALWGDQIDDATKADRLRRVQELATKHGKERSDRYLNRTMEVLVEDKNPRNPEQVMGRTRQGRQVYFDGNLHLLEGKFVNVRITHARTWSLVGELIESPSQSGAAD